MGRPLRIASDFRPILERIHRLVSRIPGYRAMGFKRVVALVAVLVLLFSIYYFGRIVVLQSNWFRYGHLPSQQRRSIAALQELRIGFSIGAGGSVEWVHLRSPIMPETIRHLQQFPDLRWLALYGSQVTDEGMQHLSALRNVEVIQLRATSVTDDGIASLRAMKQLRILDVWGDVVTDSAVERLNEHLLKCAVINNGVRLHPLGVELLIDYRTLRNYMPSDEVATRVRLCAIHPLSTVFSICVTRGDVVEYEAARSALPIHLDFLNLTESHTVISYCPECREALVRWREEQDAKRSN